ncbi:MAG: hypothetical protein WCT37_01965 [Patescibacteria group bacterium]|jgi:hypothetical protein
MTSKKQKDDDFLEFAEEVPGEDQLAGQKLAVVKKILLQLRSNLDKALRLLDEAGPGNATLVLEKLEEIKNGAFNEQEVLNNAQVVEGVFDGQKMVGADGREYQVPPNYASKSKLVEGDILKLTIDNRGNFIYKQISPIERSRVKAKLFQDAETRQYFATAGSKRWKLLTAAVTYFKGSPDDEVIILIPQKSKSAWAAVENIVK